MGKVSEIQRYMRSLLNRKPAKEPGYWTDSGTTGFVSNGLSIYSHKFLHVNRFDLKKPTILSDQLILDLT